MKIKITHIYNFLFLLLSFSIIYIVSINSGGNKRKNYEQFLLSEYKKMPEIKPEVLSEIPKFDRPDLAKLQDFFVCVDPELGRVPTERLAIAYEKTEQIRKQYNAGKQLTWQNVNSDMGGRTRTLMWDPNNASTGNMKVWAGSVTGGLWYNSMIFEEDSEWIPVNDFWNNLSISCIVYDPNNTNTFFVGTGESQTAIITYRESSGRGMGIFISEDSGETWSLLESTKDFAYVNDIVIRNENGASVIYAAVVSGLYMGSTNQSMPTDGLYRSVDNGENWEQVLPNIDGSNLAFAPSDIEIGADGRLYVGTGSNLDENGAATILYSDEGTLGTWTVFDDYANIILNATTYNIPGRVMISAANSDENIVYALFSAGFTNSDNGFNYFHEAYLLKSNDKGVSWNELEMPGQGGFASLAWHAFEIEVDPNNPDRIFVGGLDLHKTANGGNTWTHVSDWALMYYGGGSNYVHADQHAVVYNPGSSTEAVFATDGGVFHTLNADDSFPTFVQTNNNYSTLQFYSCAIHPQAGVAKYIGGLQDNGTLYYTGEDLTIDDMISGGDGAFCFYDENEPSIFYTSLYYNMYYVFENDNEVNYFDYNCGIFINPSDYDSENNIMFSNARDFGGSYNENILVVDNLPYGNSNSFVDLNTGTNTVFSHIKVSPHSLSGSSTIFIGTQDGRIFKVENAQNSPIVEEIGSSSFPTANVSCIDVGASEDTLLVCFSNYGVESVWITTDGGSIWKSVEGNLPDMPVRWCLLHPDGSRNALIATEIGVWENKDLCAEDIVWFPTVDGLANVRVDMIKIRESDYTVLAATHGRGLFTSHWSYSVETENYFANNLIIFPNPSKNIFSVQSGERKIQSITYSIFDNQGKLLFNKNADNLPFIVDLTNFSDGLYYLQINDEKQLLKLIKM